jgi:hypothetical protein
MKQKSASKQETVETALLVSDVKNLSRAVVQMADMADVAAA